MTSVAEVTYNDLHWNLVSGNQMMVVTTPITVNDELFLYISEKLFYLLNVAVKKKMVESHMKMLNLDEIFQELGSCLG